MSILDKVAFWKKKDDFDDMDPFSSSDLDGGVKQHDLGLGPSNFDSAQPSTDPFSTPQTQPLGQAGTPPSMTQPTTQNQTISSRDLELLSSKLDTIKAILQSLDARVAHIEQIAGVEQQQQMQQQKQRHDLW